jgi:hypothetical protein
MQKLLNTKERSDAFLKFLLFFLITCALVVTAVFYNYRIPRKYNEVLLAEKAVMNQEKQNQDKFLAKMREAMALRDSVKNLEPSNPYYEMKYSDLNRVQSELNALSQTGGNFSVYNEVIAILIKDLAWTQQNYSKSKERLTNYEKQLNEAKDIIKQSQQ